MINQYQIRRKELFNYLDDNSIAIIHSGYNAFRTADSFHDFVVNNNFYYLTGIDQVDVTLIISKQNNQYNELLFIDEIDELQVKWIGRTLYKNECSEISGIKEGNILYNHSFKNMINNFFQPSRQFCSGILNVYLDLEKRIIPLYNSFALDFAHQLQKDFPQIRINNLYDQLVEMRMVKSQAEIDLIVESINTTKRAIYNVIENAKKCPTEAFAEAYHNFVIKSEKKKISFESIIASGPNATILHYVDNCDEIYDNSLLLMDVGCYTKHYSSDISRTFPISGHFTKRQKEVYQVVLETNKKCIEYAKAGMSWLELNQYAKNLLCDGAKKIGLIKEDAEISKYYYHSIGHSLGLDVHDPSIYAKGLVEGMVITIEPGLYIEEEGIGIRIEDNIVITKDKAINLSIDILKEIDDLEKMFK